MKDVSSVHNLNLSVDLIMNQNWNSCKKKFKEAATSMVENGYEV